MYFVRVRKRLIFASKNLLSIHAMNKIQSILTERWSINDADYASLLLSILPALKAGNLEAVERQLDASKVMAYAVTQGAGPNVVTRWDLEDVNLPSNSVAVIASDGPLYSWDTYALERFLRLAADNPRIVGVVLWINGPGGMIAHVDLAARAIREYPKPIATYVAGTMASAHFWLGTAAQHIFLASPLCEVGSVGVMTRYLSLAGLFEKLGIVARDIYPDSADLKNYLSRQLEQGDDAPIKASLQQVHLMFAQDVAQQIGVPYDPELELYRGKLFTGQEAIDLGYVDQYGTLDDAILWVFARGIAQQTRR